jgi:hypothetical protein
MGGGVISMFVALVLYVHCLVFSFSWLRKSHYTVECSLIEDSVYTLVISSLKPFNYVMLH